MSYYTAVEVQNYSQTALELAPLLPELQKRLDADGISSDVLKDLEAIFQTGKGSVKVHAGYVQQIMEYIHELAPIVEFGARSLGVEVRHVVHRNAADGRLIADR